MTDCNKTVTIDGLPTREFATSDDFLIVHKAGQTSKVKVSNFVLGTDNIDFYTDIAAILDRLNQLETIVRTNSANWDSTYTTTNTNSAGWSTLSPAQLQTIQGTLDQYTDRWNNTSTVVEISGSMWNETNQTVSDNQGNWNSAYQSIQTNSSNWSTAYQTSLTVDGAVTEALHIIDEAYSSSMLSVYTTVKNNSASWG